MSSLNPVYHEDSETSLYSNVHASHRMQYTYDVQAASNWEETFQEPDDSPEKKNDSSYRNHIEPSSLEEVAAAKSSIYENRAADVKNGKTKNNSTSKKKSTCMALVCAIVVVLLLVFTACLATVITEVVNFKSQPVPPEQVNFTDSITAMIIQQLNHSISDLDNSLRQQEQEIGGVIANVSLNHEALSLEISTLRRELNEFTLAPDLIIITSCRALPVHAPTGYYWVRASNHSAVRVYCDMTRTCGNTTGGWMRVAEFNKTNLNQQCPEGFTQNSSGNVSTCVLNNTAGCSLLSSYSTNNIEYTKLCGRVVGYQVGTTNAFRTYYIGKGPDIDSAYVDGVSITRGHPRQHIWTFAAALDKSGSRLDSNPGSYCPCQTSSARNPPSFVGNDYFCDARNEMYEDGEYGFQSEPLWDGNGCACCTHPPWFYKQLPQPTTDNIQVRVCKYDENSNENIAIQVIEIYVQ